MDSSAKLRFQKLVTYFDDKVRTMAVLAIILVVILFPYLSWALNRQPPEPDWDKIVTQRDGAFLDINIDLPRLAKRFRADSVATVGELARRYLEDARPAALESRRNVYQDTAPLACLAVANNIGIPTPPVLNHLAQEDVVRIAVDGGLRSVPVKCSRLLAPPAASADDLLRRTKPSVILDWLQTAGPLLKSGCHLCDPGTGTRIEALQKRIQALVDNEANLIDGARTYIKSLDNGLSFGFLYAAHYEWLLHLTVISWVGVITAAFAHMVISIAERRDTGLNFVLVLIRFITAPVVAVIFVATISYGLTSEPIALNHRPMFLIFAFSAGYMSESFNLMLRQGLNKLLPSFGIATERVAGAADLKAAAARILSRPPVRTPAPVTIGALDKKLRSIVTDEAAKREARASQQLTY